MTRYRVAFTPVGWQVVDGHVAGDPLGEYGLGASEHARAKAHAAELEARDRGDRIAELADHADGLRAGFDSLSRRRARR